MGEAVKVSVIMPAYNAEKFIEAAVRSVMEQTMRDWELLVLDDCSTDDTCAVVERLASFDDRIRLIRFEKNHGYPSFVRNKGFDLCRGEFVALLDSDDIWLPEKLEKQLSAMEQTGAHFSYCSYNIIDIDGKKVKNDYIVPTQTSFKSLLGENVIGCSTVVLQRQIIERYRFDTSVYHEDFALWLQLLRDGYRAVGCSEVLAQWRYIQNSRSFNKGKSAKNRWIIYRQYLELPLFQSIKAMAAYAAAGLRKYFG